MKTKKEADFKTIYKDEYLSNCCEAKMIVTERKYDLGFFCLQCDSPCQPKYSEIEKLLFSGACYLDGDGDEYDSWEGYFWSDDSNKNPYVVGYRLRKYMEQSINSVRDDMKNRFIQFMRFDNECCVVQKEDYDKFIDSLTEGKEEGV